MILITVVIFFISIKKINPLMLSLGMLMTAITASTLALTTISKWVFYVVSLFYIGGMMILFIYIVSLLSPEKIVKPYNYKAFIFGSLGLLLLEGSNSMNSALKVSSLYQHFESLTPFVLAILLLVILIIVVKITDLWEGPLKSKLNE